MIYAWASFSVSQRSISVCRCTPRREASASSDRANPGGKLTGTRFWRARTARALAQSTWAAMSSPRSNFLSNSAALIFVFFIRFSFTVACAADGNDADSTRSSRDHGRPKFPAQLADGERSRLVTGHRGNLNHGSFPQRFRGLKINAVLGLVAFALRGIELKFHAMFNSTTTPLCKVQLNRRFRLET